MPRVMTVDDSRAVRTIIAKQLTALGCEVEEAEDGKAALDKLQDIAVDLVLLDVTMPVMDGPAMLAGLRQSGNRTPVIMLTSEAKRSVIAEALKLGIDDYILKPFKPEELAEKVKKSLNLAGGSAPAADEGEAAVTLPSPAAGAATTEGKQFIDVLVVDDMENVAKRLRALLPSHVTLHAVMSAQAALAACKERVCRVILVDYDLPDVSAALLSTQLKVLQPHAAVVALALKPPNTAQFVSEVQAKGFADALYKPFSPETMEDFVQQYFDKQDLLVREDNLVRLGSFNGKPERMERYFTRLDSLFPPALETIAAACFEGVVVDLSQATLHPERMPRLLASVSSRCSNMGLRVLVVGGTDVKKLLGGYEETKGIPCFADTTSAKAQAA